MTQSGGRPGVGQQPRGEDRVGTNTQDGLDVATRGKRFFLDVLEFLEQHLSAPGHDPSFGGGPQAPPRALEQCAAEQNLGFLERLAERGLRLMTRLRRCAQAASVNEQPYQLKVPEAQMGKRGLLKSGHTSKYSDFWKF